MQKDKKSADRDDRLAPAAALRRNNEEVLRRTLANEAREKCLGLTNAFGKCAKASGMLVVVQCRKENREMQECLSEHYNEEKFVKFLEEKGYTGYQGPRPGMAEALFKRVTG
jgi:hypothetical protein